MRRIVFLAVLVSLALATPASARCYGCNVPCEGPSGPNYECDYTWGSGPYGDCVNLGSCEGCLGWFDRSCWELASIELEPQPAEPLLGVKRVTQVIVRHDPTPLPRPTPVQIASIR